MTLHVDFPVLFHDKWEAPVQVFWKSVCMYRDHSPFRHELLGKLMKAKEVMILLELFLLLNQCAPTSQDASVWPGMTFRVQILTNVR